MLSPKPIPPPPTATRHRGFGIPGCQERLQTMDDVLLDPELAPGIVNVLKDALQETRKALAALKKENDAYRSEITRLQQSGNSNNNDVGEALQAVRTELQNAQGENRNLQAENADLLGIIEGYTNANVAESPSENDEHNPCNPNTCPVRQSVLDLEAEIDDLRTELDERTTALEDLQRRNEELNGKLDAQENTCRELQGRLDESRQQLNTRQVMFDERESQLREQLDIAMMKYRQYKTQSQELAKLQGPAAASGDTQALQSPIEPQQAHSNMQDPSLVERSEKKPKAWADIVEYVLSHPCFPLFMPNAPHELPPQIKALTRGRIMSIPHRIIYPYSEGHARVLAPLKYCKSATQPLEFSPPKNELIKVVGSVREVFYHSPNGVCYAGTFSAEFVGEVDRMEYINLGKAMKEAIIRLTFPSNEYQNATKSDQDRLRNWYVAGKAKAQYLQLRCIGFNKAFFDAILALGLIHDESQAVEVGVKRSASAAVEISRKKAKVAE